MDLWILSQSKNRLMKVDDIHIINDTQIWGNIHWLGNYKTKERALEVLNDIQRLLFNKEIKIESLKVQQEKEYEKIKELIKNGTYHFIPESSVEYIEPSCIVYEMPKE